MGEPAPVAVPGVPIARERIVIAVRAKMYVRDVDDKVPHVKQFGVVLDSTLERRNVLALQLFLTALVTHHRGCTLVVYTVPGLSCILEDVQHAMAMADIAYELHVCGPSFPNSTDALIDSTLWNEVVAREGAHALVAHPVAF